MIENLKQTGNDEKWLKKQLKSQGYNNYAQIMLATVDCQNNLSVFKLIKKAPDRTMLD